MTIASEIQRIKDNIANTYTALEEKGATIPEVLNSANLADTVATITTGGGSESGGVRDNQFNTVDSWMDKITDDNKDIGWNYSTTTGNLKNFVGLVFLDTVSQVYIQLDGTVATFKVPSSATVEFVSGTWYKVVFGEDEKWIIGANAQSNISSLTDTMKNLSCYGQFQDSAYSQEYFKYIHLKTLSNSEYDIFGSLDYINNVEEIKLSNIICTSSSTPNNIRKMWRLNNASEFLSYCSIIPETIDVTIFNNFTGSTTPPTIGIYNIPNILDFTNLEGISSFYWHGTNRGYLPIKPIHARIILKKQVPVNLMAGYGYTSLSSGTGYCPLDKESMDFLIEHLPQNDTVTNLIVTRANYWFLTQEQKDFASSKNWNIKVV